MFFLQIKYDRAVFLLWIDVKFDYMIKHTKNMKTVLFIFNWK